MQPLIRSRIRFVILLVLAVIAADQFSKIMVRKQIDHHEVLNYLGDHFSIMHVENTGAFLSLGDALHGFPKILLLSVLPLVVLGFALYYTLSAKELTRMMIIGMSLVVGGGIGNIIDRVAFGSVTDFFYISFSFFRTGIFNIADMAVTAGAIIIFFSSIRKKTTPELPPTPNPEP